MQAITEAAVVTRLPASAQVFPVHKSIVMYITSDLPHISRRRLGSYCSHFEDEEAEVPWARS